MSRRATLEQAARWALRDGAPDGAAPQGTAEVRAVLDDPALAEALAEAATFERLSDADVRAMRAARRRNAASAAALALAMIVGVGGWSSGWFTSRSAPVVALFETQRGQQRDVALADGTTVHLNGATSVEVTLSADRRLAVLRRGEAFFDVAHEAQRPFIVHAGESSTRVLGTAFDVDLGRGEVKLAVYRGKVRFGGRAASSSVDVPAGWRSRFAAGVAHAPTRFDATQQDWRQDWIDTDEMRLENLVEALNRRGGPLIQPPPAELAAIPLSGRFRLDNAQQLLGAIGAAYGFETVRSGDQLRIVPTRGDDTKTSSE